MIFEPKETVNRSPFFMHKILILLLDKLNANYCEFKYYQCNT